MKCYIQIHRSTTRINWGTYSTFGYLQYISKTYLISIQIIAHVMT